MMTGSYDFENIAQCLAHTLDPSSRKQGIEQPCFSTSLLFPPHHYQTAPLDTIFLPFSYP